MTILTQLHVIRLLALGMLLILPATSGAQQRPPILEKLSKTYGLESFGQIEAIRYTFNAEAPGLNVSRSWTWEPKTDQVTYEGKDKSGNPVKVTYPRFFSFLRSAARCDTSISSRRQLTQSAPSRTAIWLNPPARITERSSAN
jgi:hypothetical protein